MKLFLAGIIGHGQAQSNVIRQHGQKVDEIQRTFEKFPFFGGRPEPKYVFNGEPTDANGFDLNDVDKKLKDLKNFFRPTHPNQVFVVR